MGKQRFILQKDNFMKAALQGGLTILFSLETPSSGVTNYNARNLNLIINIALFSKPASGILMSYNATEES
jgi:hypothetical protein